MAAVPDLKPEQVEIIIIDHALCKQKAINPETTIALDDNPHIIAASPALLNIVPGTMSRVTSPEGLKIMAGKRIVMMPDLMAMNAYAYAVCDAIRQERMSKAKGVL